MRAKVLALTVAAAAIGSAAALAAPGNNPKNSGLWLFTGCTGPAPTSFYATKSTSSGSSFFLEDGSQFILKSIGDFTNNGFTHNDNSDENVTCTNAHSYATGNDYSPVSGTFVPHT